jgi:transposase
MEHSSFLSLGPGLEPTSISAAADGLTIHVTSTLPSSACPLCSHLAARIHSRYTRIVADLPCAGQRVQLLLHARKFFCETPTCPRQIFTERLTPFVEPRARMTCRLSQAIQTIGLATCGKLGARLSARLGIQTSWMTVLHRIMAKSSPPESPVRKLGIDDFALKRGRTYATILVDLERHQAIELLPDRQAETAAAWMHQHPDIELVGRDRGGDYAAAARKGAPQAIQVADRFHLMKNLTEAVGLALVRCWTKRQQARKPEPQASAEAAHDPPPLPTVETWRSHRSSTQEHGRLVHQAARLAEFEQMLALRAQGLRPPEIAQRLGKSTVTVRRWLAQGASPEGTQRRPRPSQLDAYVPYVLARWQAGCHNGLQLWREIAEQGYGGTARMMYRFIAALRADSGALEGDPARSTSPQLPAAKKAVWLVVRDPADLEADEREALTTLCQASPTAQTLYPLVQEFRQLLHRREGERLDDWLAKARASQIKELQSFAHGIEQDKAAVVAGLTRNESNAQTEGQNTKLKLIKRTMYGRAGFPLLRQRVLHAL